MGLGAFAASPHIHIPPLSLATFIFDSNDIYINLSPDHSSRLVKAADRLKYVRNVSSRISCKVCCLTLGIIAISITEITFCILFYFILYIYIYIPCPCPCTYLCVAYFFYINAAAAVASRRGVGINECLGTLLMMLYK